MQVTGDGFTTEAPSTSRAGRSYKHGRQQSRRLQGARRGRESKTLDYPKLELPDDVVNGLGIKKAAPHAVVLKLVTTNICGSDQHMVRGRTTAPVGQTLGS